jgi:hypothetical protein
LLCVSDVLLPDLSPSSYVSLLLGLFVCFPHCSTVEQDPFFLTSVAAARCSLSGFFFPGLVFGGDQVSRFISSDFSPRRWFLFSIRFSIMLVAVHVPGFVLSQGSAQGASLNEFLRQVPRCSATRFRSPVLSWHRPGFVFPSLGRLSLIHLSSLGC